MKLNVSIHRGPSNLYYLKSWREAGKPGLDVGNFTAIGLYDGPDLKTAGQVCWVELNQPETDWIKALNVSSYKRWEWSVSADGTIYLGSEAETTWKWPRICLGSPDDAPDTSRNMVHVLEETWNAVRIAGIPCGSFTDKPWLVQTAYCVFPDGHTSPNPWYRMPLFDPASGFKVSVGGMGLWLEKKWLHSRV